MTRYALIDQESGAVLFTYNEDFAARHDYNSYIIKEYGSGWYVSATQWYHSQGTFHLEVTDVTDEQAVLMAEAATKLCGENGWI